MSKHINLHYKMISKILMLLSALHLMPMTAICQKVDLQQSLERSNIEVFNRQISAFENNAVELDAQNSDGLGILKDVAFETGTIKLDVLGENNPGRSFIGLAFNVQNDSTYEAVYFRPFNFVAEEQIRKDHMVQYIAHPEYTWRRLRDERTAEFESEIQNPPHPDQWFGIKIQVLPKEVIVFLQNRSEPVLKVERLVDKKSNKIGLWTGFGSSGRFRNLVISRDKSF
jgi:hypothetical protein